MHTDCPKCDGYGILDGEHEPETCDHCGGSGHAPRAQYLSPPPGHEATWINWNAVPDSDWAAPFTA